MFRKLGKAVMAVIDGIAKIIAVILWVLGMWIPALYCAVFFIVCSVQGVAMQGNISIAFFAGLGVSTALGLCFAFWRLKKAALKKRRESGVVVGGKTEKRAALRKVEQPEDEPQPALNDKPKGNKRRLSGSAQSQPQIMAQNQPNTRQSQPYYAGQPSAGMSLQYYVGQPQDGGGAAQDDSDLYAKYFDAKTSVPEANITSQTYKRVQERGQEQAKELLGRLSCARRSEEQPLVFATRSDPDVFIYEYSDRLEFWRKTGQGMERIGAEPKKNRFSGR